METDFITPADPRWRDTLKIAQHDMYNLPEYAALCAKYDDAVPVAFYASEGSGCCLIPLLRRPLPGCLAAPSSWTDAISPYGYSSALFAGDAHWRLRAVQEFVKVCVEHDIVSVFVRLHPLLDVPAAALDVAGVRVTQGSTVHVDLTLPEEVLHKQLRKVHRVISARLFDQKFSLTVDDWSLFGRFMQIYRDTMLRLDSNPYYLFPDDYFHSLRDALGSRLHLLSVIAPDHSVAAAGLFTETNGIAQYHLSGTATEHQRSAPSRLMLISAITWAKAAGNRVLHLGGGVGSQHDGLYEFKAGFSPLRSAFQTWRVVCNPERYSGLLGTAGQSSAPGDGFFPAYRKPMDRSQDPSHRAHMS